jgi:hypothetical protein
MRHSSRVVVISSQLACKQARTQTRGGDRREEVALDLMMCTEGDEGTASSAYTQYSRPGKLQDPNIVSILTSNPSDVN